MAYKESFIKPTGIIHTSMRPMSTPASPAPAAPTPAPAKSKAGHPHKNLGKYLHKKGTTPNPAGQHTSTTAAGPRGYELPQENASGGMGGKSRY